MNERPPTFVLDANVFIEAHRRYYAFDLCPGFWECLLHHYAGARLVSIDRVRDEILAGDALEDWVKNQAPRGFFASSRDLAVTRHFGSMMAWVQSESRFLASAKAEFAQAADGWLAAYAKAHGCVLVTHEEHAPEARKRVPLPNVCRQFGVAYMDSFAMLRSLSTRFDWTPETEGP